MVNLSFVLSSILLVAGGIKAQDNHSNDSPNTAALRGSEGNKLDSKNFYTFLNGPDALYKGNDHKSRKGGHGRSEGGHGRTPNPYKKDESLTLPITREQAIEMTDPNYGVCEVKHIVTFKFKQGSSDTDIAEVTRRFKALREECTRSGGHSIEIEDFEDIGGPGSVGNEYHEDALETEKEKRRQPSHGKGHSRPYIQSVEAGFQNGYEGADQGHQVGYILTFKSLGDRNYYVGKPFMSEDDSDLYDTVHDAFKNFAGGFLDAAFVFDFCVQ